MDPADRQPAPATRPDARPVLVGFDGSLAARAALRFAAQHAASVRAPLRVLAVAENLTENRPENRSENLADHRPLSLDAAERVLADADRFLRTCGPGDARTAMRFGPALDALTDAAAGSRLLVLGRPDPWGSLGRTLLQSCGVPLALVPPFVPADRGTRREDVAVHDVLVALAGDEGDERVLTVGREWAVRRRSRLHVVHALRPPARSSWPAPCNSATATFTTMTHRPLADAVVDAAARACLVVVGQVVGQHVGTDPARRRDTEELLARIDRPVLVLPG